MKLRVFILAIAVSTIVVVHTNKAQSEPNPQSQQSDSTWAPANCGGAVRFDSIGETWTFLISDFGLRIKSEANDTTREVVSDAIKALRKVRRISLLNSEYKQDSRSYCYLGIAIESVSQDGKLLEYRMGQCRIPESTWAVSDVLLTRPINSPIHSIGIGLPGGDSLMMTLQTLQRNGGSPPDNIETHTFVNHCPSPGPIFGKVTQHYSSKALELVTAFPAKG